MSFHYDDAIPPPRKPSQITSLKGRVSTAYPSTTPALSIEEPTPEMIQNEFEDIFDSKSSSRLLFGESISGPSKQKTVLRTSQGQPLPPTSSPHSETQTHSRGNSNETAFAISPTRRASIPIRKSPIRPMVDQKPVLIHCEQCRSQHSVEISESDRAKVIQCNVTPVPPTPAPSILEIYHLPGYQTLNESGQIVVHTEAELLSYTRKIFVKSDNYIGDFPSSRDYYYDAHDTSSLPSMTSTPDDARASYALGHSKYLGQFTKLSTTKTTEKSSNKSSKAVSRHESPSPAERSRTSGPLEPYRPAPPNMVTKPYSRPTSLSRATSPIAFVRTIVPSDSSSMRPQAPQHASSSRQSSPRNLHSLGIYSESEIDLPIPTTPEYARDPTEQNRSSRSLSRSGKEYNTQTVQPSELHASPPPARYELNSSTQSSGLSASKHAPHQPDSPNRGRVLGRR